MGTFFAMEQAVENPDFVKSLLLLASPLKIGVKPTAAVNSMKSLFGLVRENDKIGKAYKNAHSVKLNLRLWEYAGWIPRYQELFKESHRARETVKKISMPCFFYQSKKDELVSMKSIHYIPKKDNIKAVVLENSRHFIYDSKDAELLRKAATLLFTKE